MINYYRYLECSYDFHKNFQFCVIFFNEIWPKLLFVEPIVYYYVGSFWRQLQLQILEIFKLRRPNKFCYRRGI